MPGRPSGNCGPPTFAACYPPSDISEINVLLADAEAVRDDKAAVKAVKAGEYATADGELMAAQAVVNTIQAEKTYALMNQCP